MKFFILKYKLHIFFVITICFDPALAKDQIDTLINMRIKNMQNSEISMQVIKESIKTSNYRRAEKNAIEIRNWASVMINYFPIGSEATIKNHSEASGNIWTNKFNFRNLINALIEASDKMVEAARMGNKPLLKKAIKSAESVCNVCHKIFRN